MSRSASRTHSTLTATCQAAFHVRREAHVINLHPQSLLLLPLIRVIIPSTSPFLPTHYFSILLPVLLPSLHTCVRRTSPPTVHYSPLTQRPLSHARAHSVNYDIITVHRSDVDGIACTVSSHCCTCCVTCFLLACVVDFVTCCIASTTIVFIIVYNKHNKAFCEFQLQQRQRFINNNRNNTMTGSRRKGRGLRLAGLFHALSFLTSFRLKIMIFRLLSSYRQYSRTHTTRAHRHRIRIAFLRYVSSAVAIGLVQTPDLHHMSYR